MDTVDRRRDPSGAEDGRITEDESLPATVLSSNRLPSWQVIVSAVLVAFLGAQLFAGWKFLNGPSYPIVGSAMFNGPPIPGSADFQVPRVIGITLEGRHVEMDQHTFGLEPFEWRAWIIDNLETVPQDMADGAGAALATTYTSQTGQQLVSLQVWRVPALTDDFRRGRLVRTVHL